ncbi:MAG: hypothetical protein IJD31_00025 [Lachnospiraceae bacterium]|nr:hypothetical protein [Lachnospiraceae bacterium]
MKKKNAFLGMVLLQISILMVFIVATLFKEPDGYEFESDDLVNIEDIGEGQIILSPYITLPIGSYKVYAEYELEGQKGDFSIVSLGTASEDILTNSSVVLREGKHTLQNDFRVRWKLDGVSIKFQTMAGERINVKHVGIMETNAFLKQSIVYLFGLFAVIDGIIFFSWYWKNSVADEKRMSRREVGSVILIALLASLPLGLHYLLNGQDMEFHLLRIEGLYEALRCGQFPVRIHPNYMEGYGYPTGIFYPELFLYFPALLRLMGVPLMHAYKWFVLAQNIATAGVAWYSGKILFQKKTSAAVFCLLYTLAPYRLINTYYRAAVGESLAMIFLPLIVAGMYLLLAEIDLDKKTIRQAIALLVIGMAGVLQSHILSCELVAIFVVGVILFCWKRFWRKKVWLSFAGAVGITVLLNLWFLIPFISAAGLEVKVLLMTPGILTHQGLNIWQLFAFLPEASGHSMSLQEGIAGEMPFQLGWAVVLLMLFAIYGIAKMWKGRRESMNGLGIVATCLGMLALWMTTHLFPWDVFGRIPKIGKMLNTVQFPWRYLGIATILLVIAGLIAVQLWQNEKIRQTVLIAVSAVSVITALWFFQSMISNADYYSVYDGAGLDSYALVGEEYLYQGTDLDLLKERANREDWYVQSGTNVTCVIEPFGDKTDYRLPLLYYPWYTAKDATTGETIKIVKGENNVAFLELPEDYSGAVKVSFEEPVAWKVGNAISLATLITLVVCVYIDRRKKAQFSEVKKD